jgi:hypothetical protein
MWQKILTPAQRIEARRRLVIQNGISAWRTGLTCSASMAAVGKEHAIYLLAFSRIEVAVRSACRKSLAKEGTGADSMRLKLTESLSRLLSISAMRCYQTFDSFVGAGTWAPIGIVFSNARDSISRLRLYRRKLCRLSGRRLDGPPIDDDRAGSGPDRRVYVAEGGILDRVPDDLI